MNKARLKLYYPLMQEIMGQKERLQEMRMALASPQAACASGMPRRRRTDVMECKITDMLAYESMVEKNVQKLQEECAAIEQAIEGIPDPMQREICRLRYLQGLSWPEISDRVGYEFTQCHRLHNRALRCLSGS